MFQTKTTILALPACLFQSDSEPEQAEEEEPHTDNEGYIKNDNLEKVYLTKEQLKLLIQETPRSATGTCTDKDFQEVFNGVFSAEGNWGYSWRQTQKGLKLIPLWNLGQNASLEAIRFFKIAIAQFPLNTLKLVITRSKSGAWHIKLTCTNWNVIVYHIMPYLTQLYAEKYTGLLKIKRIFELQTAWEGADLKATKMEIAEVVYLAYSISPGGNSAKTSLDEKISEVIGGIKVKDLWTPYYKNLANSAPITMGWLMGIAIGDGSWWYRVMVTRGKDLNFKPHFELGQTNTQSNRLIIDSVAQIIEEMGISLEVKLKDNKYNIKVGDVKNIGILIAAFKPLEPLSFWSQSRIDTINCALSLQEGPVSKWKELKIKILQVIYHLPTEHHTSLRQHLDFLDENFIESETAHIKHASGFRCHYQVNLPKHIGSSFSNSTYTYKSEASRIEALASAINQRDKGRAAFLAKTTDWYFHKYGVGIDSTLRT